jgi:hypothetical protein
MAVITRLYDTRADAESAVRGLEAAGMGHEDISLIGGNNQGQYATTGTLPTPEEVAATSTNSTATTEEAAGAGATAGTIIGGGAGLLAGIGAMAIPGLGPVVAAGWLVAALTGAGVGAAVGGGAGGVVGSLTEAGVPEEDAHVYAEGVRRGSFLVTARVDSKQVSEAQRILSNRGMDAAQRRSVYQEEGWTRFDETAPPFETVRPTLPPS